MDDKGRLSESQESSVKATSSDPIGPRTSAEIVFKESTKAFDEEISKSLLGIAFPSAAGFRSGVYVRWRDQHFVVTAGHELKDENIKDMHVIARADEALQTVPLETAKSAKSRLRPAFDGRVISHKITNPDTTDLLVMHVEPFTEKPFPLPHPLSGTLRVPEGEVAIAGFPQALSTPLGSKETPQFAVVAYLHYTKLVANKANLQNFNPFIHFLMDYGKNEYGYAGQFSARGMSGGPVWMIPQIDPKVVLWKPEPVLCGIQINEYTNSQLLKATSLGCAKDIMEKLLK